MDQPSSSELDLIRDPETGLALLAKCRGKKTPEQALDHIFWLGQFTFWRNWRAGNVLAAAGALMHCAIVKRPPPAWLFRAVDKLCGPDDENRARDDLANHFLRWRTVELVRSQGKAHGDAIFEEAAKLVADTDAKGTAETMRKSHALIRRAADDTTVTLQGYRRAVKERDRRRKRRRKSKK